MNTFKKKIFVIAIILLYLSPISSQNLYDHNHSFLFAKFLYKTQQYKLAAEEFERVIFLKPENDTAKFLLIKSYRFEKQYSFGINRLEQMFIKQNISMSSKYANEYIKLLLLDNQTNKSIEYIKLNKSLDKQELNNYYISAIMLNRSWSEANNFIEKNDGVDNKLKFLCNKANSLKYKSPFLATSLSIFVPGLGKIYSKNWKDGLISFVFIVTNAWQSYRGFNKYGPNSAYGWIFGGLSVGFYGGNIFGSYKAAKRYNHKLEDDIYYETENYIFSKY